MRWIWVWAVMLVSCSHGMSAERAGMVSSLAGQRPVALPLSRFTPLAPPARYRAIHAAAEECTGKTGSFDRIVWLSAPGRSFTAPDGVPNAIGFWQVSRGRGSADTIVIAADWQTTEWVVKHELIHYLLQQSHPADLAESDRIWGRLCHATWGYLE